MSNTFPRVAPERVLDFDEPGAFSKNRRQLLVSPNADEDVSRDVLLCAWFSKALGSGWGEDIIMVKLTIEIPEEAFSALREAPERFASELRFAAAVHWYREGRISGSKAAQIAGMTRLAFLDELARRKFDVVKVDLDQLRHELEDA